MKLRAQKFFVRLFSILLVATFFLLKGSANAQSTPIMDIENDPQYQETQKFLSKTRSLIERTRAETDARAKEIEALTNRVGELISNMGSTSEDASNLRSELSVQIDLLEIERETTEGLRRQILTLNKNLEAQKESNSETEDKLRSVIVSLRKENEEMKKNLNYTKAKSKDSSNAEVKSLRLKHAKAVKNLEDRFKSEIVSLRKENEEVKKRIVVLEKHKKSSTTIEIKLRAKLASLRTEYAKALKRLNQGLEKAFTQTKVNHAIIADLTAAKTKVEKLQKEIKLLKQKQILPKNE